MHFLNECNSYLLQNKIILSLSVYLIPQLSVPAWVSLYTQVWSLLSPLKFPSTVGKVGNCEGKSFGVVSSPRGLPHTLTQLSCYSFFIVTQKFPNKSLAMENSCKMKITLGLKRVMFLNAHVLQRLGSANKFPFLLEQG